MTIAFGTVRVVIPQRTQLAVAVMAVTLAASLTLGWGVARAAVPRAQAAVPRTQAAGPHAQPRRTAHPRFAPSEVVVVARTGLLDATPDGRPLPAHGALGRTLAEFGLDHARRADPAPVAGSNRSERIWVLSSRAQGFDPVAVSEALRHDGDVLAASPNYHFGLMYTAPNDLYVSFQWYVDDGSFADIRLPYAWDTARGDSSVTIAIIDTGVDTTHPDLASKIWHNPDEIPGNGIDDDGNGLVDDWEGWDFGVGDNDPKPEYMADASGIDVGFHGTFCAGIAAAATNNDDGIAGAGWNCRIMALKAADPVGGLTSEAIAGAMAYAVDKHASVISMSFGGPGDPGVPEFFQSLVDMAVGAGTVCVAAAGNDGDSLRVYPAACEHVLSVAATDPTNVRATFSNFGSWVDVAAPGSTMWSTIAQNYVLTDLDQIIYIFFFGWDGVSPYMYGDGTSFACPLTAGVCGLVRARYPSLTPALVMQQIITTGDAVSFDEPIGPKVNAERAVTQVPTAVAVEASTPAPSMAGASPNPIAGAGTIRFALGASGPARLALYDAAGRRVRTLVEGPLAAGQHTIGWDGRDDRGAQAASGVYFARLNAGRTELCSKVVLMRP